MLRPVIKSCFFYSPAPGYLCQSERFSCLRFLSQGDYLCGAGEGFSELQGVGAGSALVCYLTPAVLRKAGSLFFFLFMEKKNKTCVWKWNPTVWCEGNGYRGICLVLQRSRSSRPRSYKRNHILQYKSAKTRGFSGSPASPSPTEGFL